MSVINIKTFQISGGSGGGSTSDYSQLSNKPKINSVTLTGDKSLADLGFEAAFVVTLTPHTSDKTLAEIEAARAAGQVIVGKYEFFGFPVYSASTILVPGVSCSFQFLLPMDNNFVDTMILLDSEGEVTEGAVSTQMVSGTDVTNWNGKYTMPAGGIPASDLASEVRTSLGKADTALQTHQDISGKEDTGNKVTSLSSASTDTQYPSAKCVYDIIGNIETLLAAL